MAKFALGKPVTTETATVEVDAGLAVGAHRFRLSVVNAAGLPSRTADEVVVQVTQSRVVLPPISPPIAPPIATPIATPIAPPLRPADPRLPLGPASRCHRLNRCGPRCPPDPRSRSGPRRR